LHNTVIFITGAGTGIGTQIAMRLYESGARLACVSLQYDYVFPQDCLTYTGDIFDQEFMSKSLADLKKNVGKIDVLINNIGYGMNAVCDDISEYEFTKMLRLNVESQVNMLRKMECDMRFGLRKVINIASSYAYIPLPTLEAYAATKRASLQMTREMAEEFPNLSFACVCPGYMKHPKHVQYFSSDSGQRFLYHKIPMKRVGDPFSELTPAVLLLCCPEWNTSRYIEMVIDGGLSAHIGLES